ncbi:MAG: AAA family ATPase [Candidatus Omnitrophota bacterium]
MKVISIVNQKGGCGKTITAVNLASALSRKGSKTLLIDLDPQAHATCSLQTESPYTITDILERVSENKPVGAEFASRISDNFHFISSRIGLTYLEHKFSSRNDKLKILSYMLSQISSDFDYCILDCPPNLGIITLNALWASSYALIPINTCEFSLRGAEILKNMFLMLKEAKDEAPTPFYLLTQVDRRSRFAREFIDEIKSDFGDLLLETMIRTNTHLREAAAHGMNIFDYKPDSRGAKDYGDLSDEIEKTTSERNWAPLFIKGREFSDVYVAGDFNDWKQEDKYRLKRIGIDTWGINLSLNKGTYRYKFLTNGAWICDPHNKQYENDSYGGKNSLLVIR